VQGNARLLFVGVEEAYMLQPYWLHALVFRLFSMVTPVMDVDMFSVAEERGIVKENCGPIKPLQPLNGWHAIVEVPIMPLPAIRADVFDNTSITVKTCFIM
jgi:hypothetical protein